MKKYKLFLYADDYQLDMIVSYLRYWIWTEKVEVIGVIYSNSNYFTKLNKFKCFDIKDINQIEYDYIITCDFKSNSNKVQELVLTGNVPRNKIIAGKALENPYFTFEKWERIRNSNITIISENCWGGVTYNDLQLEFMSPTINMYFPMSDFFKFVNNLTYYFEQNLEFKEIHSTGYPIGKLDDISLHFNHYKNQPFEK